MSKRVIGIATAVLASVLGTLLGGCTVFGIRTAEEASYRVVDADGAFEVREYEPLLVAETVTTGDYDRAGNAAFRRLAGYIFGGNQSRESVAMTAPVFQEAATEPESEKIAMTTPVFQRADGDTWTQTFVLPAEYTLETLPIPDDENVRVRRIPAARVATVRYSGLISEEAIDEHTRRLEEWMAARGLPVAGAARSAGYDPPWTIPFLRRNEVQIPVGEPRPTATGAPVTDARAQ